MNPIATRRRVVFFALATLMAAGGCDGGGPTPVAVGTAFDGGLADSLVRRQVDFGPRVPGTEAHRQALEWMTQYLRERADEVEQMPFTHVTQTGDTLALTNVWARFNVSHPSRILLLAHWDSRPVSENAADPADRERPVPGANDGASGVAVLLAIADDLNRTSPAVGVDILLTDGEDYGHDPVTFRTVTTDMFLGARHFARERGASYRPLFGILLDLVGDREPRFPWEGFSLQFAPEVVRRVWDVAAELGYAGIFLSQPGQAISDDHVPLNEVGIRTIDVIDLDYPYWHTPEDTPDKVSQQTLQIVGDVVLEVVRRQGN